MEFFLDRLKPFTIQSSQVVQPSPVDLAPLPDIWQGKDDWESSRFMGILKITKDPLRFHTDSDNYDLLHSSSQCLRKSMWVYWVKATHASASFSLRFAANSLRLSVATVTWLDQPIRFDHKLHRRSMNQSLQAGGGAISTNAPAPIFNNFENEMKNPSCYPCTNKSTRLLSTYARPHLPIAYNLPNRHYVHKGS